MKRMMLLALCTTIGFGGAVTGCGLEREPAPESQQTEAKSEEESTGAYPTKESFYGRVYDEALEQELRDAVSPSIIRAYGPDDVYTDEYVEKRLNVVLDGSGHVVNLWFDCGSWPSKEESDSEGEGEGDSDSDESGNDETTEEPTSSLPAKESFYGRVMDAALAQELRDAVNPTVIRVYQVGDPITEDYIDGRLNVAHDEEGRVAELWFDCGPWRNVGHGRNKPQNSATE